MFFAVYTGTSMNPTLREPEIMEIVPYDRKPARVGDVVFFLPPGSDRAVVHRVVRVTPTGLATRGDNNAQVDSVLLQPQDIFGQVVAASRGLKRRKISGRLEGRLTCRGLRWWHIIDRAMSPLLMPVYHTLSRLGVARLLPAQCRPRVVVFHAHGHTQNWLLLGRQVIGRYDDRKQHWQIQRPFRLLVEERKLPRPLEECAMRCRE